MILPSCLTWISHQRSAATLLPRLRRHALRAAVRQLAPVLFALVFSFFSLSWVSAGEPGLHKLQWTLDGKSLIVSDAWLLNVENGSWQKLPPAAALQGASGSSENLQLLPSPDGKSVLQSFQHFEPGKHLAFWVRGVQESKKAIDIPQWFRQTGSDAEIFPEDVLHTFAWLDSEHIYVHQAHRMMQFEDQCGIWNLSAGAWVENSHCITGDFHLLWKIQPGPKGKIAVYTAGEGHPGVLLANYDLKTGQTNWETPSFDLYPFGPLEVHFTSNEEILFTTPCLLDENRDRPCSVIQEEESPPWKLFSWTPGQKGFRLLQDFFPEGAQPHPIEIGTIAWAREGDVCVGDPGSKEPAQCFSTLSLP